jgi:transcriptional activator SPT8
MTVYRASINAIWRTTTEVSAPLQTRHFQTMHIDLTMADSNGSSENEQDEVMEDVDEAEGDNDPEEDEAMEDEEEEDPEAEDTFGESQDRPENAPNPPDRDAAATHEGDTGTAASQRSATPIKAGTPLPTPRWRPTVRPEAVAAKLYDIVPTMAAPQSTSINAIGITPDLRYWITGGSDGYIRKYDGPGTINGKQLLTVAQRHPFVDSVNKACILMSYWENEEPTPPNSRGTEEPVISPVYSLAVHSQALWLLSGLESGGINLQSVRHDEGKRICCLQQHTNAVSVLALAPDEKSVLSGSWDKNILDWDLNTGLVKRTFEGTGGQISAIELRPSSGDPIPFDAHDEPIKSETFSAGNGKPLPNGVFGASATAGPNGVKTDTGGGDAGANAAQASPAHESLFGGSDAGSLFGETAGGGFGVEEDDEFSHAMEMTLHGEGGHEGGMVHSADMAMARMDMSAPAADGQPAAPPAAQPAAQGSSGANTQLVATTQNLTNGPLKHQGMINGSSMDTSDASATTTQTDTAPVPSSQQQRPSSSSEAREPSPPSLVYSSQPPPSQFDPTQASDTTFFSAAIDGTIRIWDKRVPNPVARIGNRHGVPPWCMGACWSPDGNWIYAGRRNGTVEEFNIHKARSGWAPERVLKFPQGSGPVSAVRSMVNGRHLVCASHDILRLYDLRDMAAVKHSSVPFLIIPGPPRAGVISCLYVDPSSRFMISAAGTRGWEGSSTEVLIGYEIGVPGK